MRVTRYEVELNSEQKNILVKKSSKNCTEIHSLDSPEKVKNLLNYLYSAGKKAEEYTWLIALNTKCKPIGIFEISHGTANYSVVQPREIFVRLCLCGAVSFIVAHNHPSGDPTPSREDIKITKRLFEAGQLMGINYLDHIIVYSDNYYSFKENDLM